MCWARSTEPATAMWRWCAGWCAWRSSASWSWLACWRFRRWLFGITPQSFLPDEDQGAIFAALRLPEGASINRTEAVVKQVEDIVRAIPGVEGVLSVVGLNFIDYVASSNQASSSFGSSPTKSAPIRRKAPARSLRGCGRRLAAIEGAIAFPFNLPPILGLGSTGGFQYALEALQGQSPTDVAATLRGLLVAANRQPELAGVFSTYAADTPQIYLEIDRDKAQVLGVKIGDIFNALQSTLGSLLRQRLQRFRPDMAGQHPGRHAVSRQRRRYRAHLCTQCQGRRWFRSARWPRPGWCKGRRRWCATTAIRGAMVNGAPSRVTVPARRSPRWSGISAATLPAGYSFEWTGTALQEMAAGGQTGVVLGVAVLFAYLFLVALYESWNIPIPALLSVSVAILGALRRRGVDRIEFRCLRPDRSGRADRAGRQERHFDRRVRGGAARSSARTSLPPQSKRPHCDSGR